VNGGDAAPLRFCFILEARYRHSRLPLNVVHELAGRGHDVTVLDLERTIANVAAVVTVVDFDAVVLRTVSSGPGLSVLESAAAARALTINDAAAIRGVRDKAVAAATARAHGLPFPETYIATRIRQLEQVPKHHFPLVIKPNEGGFGDEVRLIRSSEEVPFLDEDAFNGRTFVAQPWVPNPGYDIKLYNTGQGVFAVRYPSPLGGENGTARELVAVTPALRSLAERIGRAFGLHFYGADVVRGPHGWVVVDVNDFPSFGMVPDAAVMIATTVVEIVRRSRASRAARAAPIVVQR